MHTVVRTFLELRTMNTEFEDAEGRLRKNKITIRKLKQFQNSQFLQDYFSHAKIKTLTWVSELSLFLLLLSGILINILF